MKLNTLHQIARITILALFFVPLPSYASEVDELYAEIETIFAQPNGSNILKERASELSEELAITILDEDPERVEKATFLMRYADPAPSWDAAVSNLLASEESVNTAAGLSILEVHGLLGNATKNQVTHLIADFSSTTILSGAARIAGRASLTEVIPLLRKELWSDDIERNTAAILGLIEFGPNASYLISDLEKKLRQIDQVQGSASEQGNYLSYIPKADKTGTLKNLLEKAIIELTPVSTVTDGGFVVHVEQQIETITPQTSEPTREEPAEAAPVEIVEETPEESTNWLLWLIGALVVLGGLGLVVRRKN